MIQEVRGDSRESEGGAREDKRDERGGGGGERREIEAARRVIAQFLLQESDWECCLCQFGFRFKSHGHFKAAGS